MELPQEIEVFYTLPAVRRELAQALMKHNLTQRVIAKKLGVTEAAVSQYLSNKRGTNITHPQDIMHAVDAAAKRIATSDEDARKEIQHLSDLFKANKVICELHKKHGPVKDGCSLCYE